MLFDFCQNDGILAVPLSWIIKKDVDGTGPVSKKKQQFFCYFPCSGTRDYAAAKLLISLCSLPNRETWTLHPGCVLGRFESLEAAERRLNQLSGEDQTESEAEAAQPAQHFVVAMGKTGNCFTLVCEA